METYYVVSWWKDSQRAGLDGYWFDTKEEALKHKDFDERVFVVTIDVEVDSDAAQP